jgi:hypothetical protein
MTGVPKQSPSRPHLRLRVGITGARMLRSDQLERIDKDLRYLLAYTKEFVERLSRQSNVREAYAIGFQDETYPIMQVISPLARGADRLAARTALSLCYELYVPMPFSQTEYEKDFTGQDEGFPEGSPLTPNEDLAEFQALLAEASAHLTLDGGRESPVDSGRAYEAVGRFVVRHSDLLIAIWDGSQSNGRGGTAEIVHFASSVGVAILWIHASNEIAPVWITDIRDLRDPLPASEGLAQSPMQRLDAYLTHLIEPPNRIRRDDPSWIGRLATLHQEKSVSPAADYFAERPLPHRTIWTAYSKMMAWASRCTIIYAQTQRPEDPVAQYWFDQYQMTDSVAGQQAARYRSTYVLVILLATLALFFGASALCLAITGVHARLSLAAAMCELACLALIIGLVAASLRCEWHARSIEYRLLAELFRKQETLAPLGWALPIGNVQHLADTERLAWVGWLFAAMQRAAPLPRGSIRNNAISRITLQHLIEEQLNYHRGRFRTDTRAAETFETMGSLVFLAVIACVVLKICAEAFDLSTNLVIILGLMATVLPAVSAALVGIRRYAELELLAEQSKHMIAELERSRERVARLNLRRPLVSQDLGVEAAAVAATMLGDLEGWGRLFRGKLMEAA